MEISPDGSRLVFTARKGEGPEPALGPEPLGVLGAAARRDRGSGAAVLVARRAFHRVLRGPRAEEGRGRRRSGIHAGRGEREPGRNLESGRRHPFHARRARAGLPRSGRAEERRPSRPSTATDDATHRYPRFLPDGRHFLYLVRHSGRRRRRRTRRSASDRSIRRSRRSSSASPPTPSIASGYLLYVREGRSSRSASTSAASPSTGEPVIARARRPHGRAVQPWRLLRLGRAACSPTRPERGDGVRCCDGSTARARSSATVGEPAEFFNGGDPEISPTARGRPSRSWTCAPAIADIWMIDLASGTRSRFTTGTGDKVWSAWSRATAAHRLQHADARGGYDIVVQADRRLRRRESGSCRLRRGVCGSRRASRPTAARSCFEMRHDQRDDHLFVLPSAASGDRSP